MFDCVRLAKVLGEFDHVRLMNVIKVNQMIGVQLGVLPNVQLTMAGFR